MFTMPLSDGAAGMLTIAALIALLAAVYAPFGDYMAHVFTTPKHWGVDKRAYRLFGVNPDAEQTARSYTYSRQHHLLVRDSDRPASTAVQPRPSGHAVGDGPQHSCLVRDQHQLAVVRR